MSHHKRRSSLLGTHPSLELESKEAAQDLLPLLAESGQVVPCIKVIFDRKMDKKVYSEILSVEAGKKGEEIKRICNDNYTDFIDAIDQLLGVQLSVTQLKSEIKTLNMNINIKGNELTTKIDRLIRLKKIRRNMDIAINRLNRMKHILTLMKKITELINNKKYIAALKNLNQLTTHIIQLKKSTVTQQIFDALPLLTDKIKKAVNVNFSEWLHNINKESRNLGSIATVQTKHYLNSIDNENDDGLAPQAAQDQMRLAIQKQFGDEVAHTGDTTYNLVPATPRSAVASGNESLFERIENLDFNPVYQCIHVHETLQSLDEFRAVYIEQRSLMKNDILQKLSLVNLSTYTSLSAVANKFGPSKQPAQLNAAMTLGDLDPSKIDNRSSHLNRDFFSSLCGFFVMEHAVCSRYQQLRDPDELQQEWASAVTFLTKRLKKEVIDKAKTPSELIEVKYELYVLGRSIENYDFKVTGITVFLEDLRVRFEQTLNTMLLSDTRKILGNEDFKSLVVTSEDAWINIEEFGLNVNIAQEMDRKTELEKKMKARGKGRHGGKRVKLPPQDDFVEDGGFFDSVRKQIYDTENQFNQQPPKFPHRVPFSISVIIICQNLCDFIEEYHVYAKHLSDMSSHIRNAVQRGIVNTVCGELKRLVTGTKASVRSQEEEKSSAQTRRGTQRKRVGIAELSQLAVNMLYLERACGFFEKELYEENANQEFMEEQEIVIPKLHQAREELMNVQSTCINSLVEHLGRKVEVLMNACMSKISWMPDKANNKPQDWVSSMMQFLERNLKDRVKYLPQEYRETALFLACNGINKYLVNILCSDGTDNDEMAGMMGSVSDIGDDAENGASSDGAFKFVKKFNILAIYNLNLDVRYLENFANKEKIQGLAQSFKMIRQIIDLLLSGKNMSNYLDEDFRMQHYAYVSPSQLRNLLEKYNTLGVFTSRKISKELNNINIDKNTVKSLLKSLKDIA